MLNSLLTRIDSLRATRVRQNSRYGRATADIPPTLYAYWKSTARDEFKGIPSDAFFFARAADGLLTFFDCVRTSAKPCALPSAAADSVWHAWSRMDGEHLAWFCRKHFGHDIPHTEAADMGVNFDAALANTLVAARRLGGMPAGGAGVPGLFSLDRDLRMPKGFAYTTSSHQVGFRNMSQRGVAEGWIHAPASLAPAALLAAGLISQLEYEASLQKASAGGFDGASLAMDGGDACGGSCGGGCGGGCGS